MSKRRKTTFVVRGNDNIVISGTGNFYNKHTEGKTILEGRIAILEQILHEKEKIIAERDLIIKTLMEFLLAEKQRTEKK